MSIFRQWDVLNFFCKLEGARVPFLFDGIGNKLDTKAAEAGLKVGKFAIKNARKEENAAGFEGLNEAWGRLVEEIGSEVRTDNFEFAPGYRGRFPDIRLIKMNRAGHRIERSVFPGNLHGVAIEIEGVDRSVMHFCGSDSEQSRAGSDIQECRMRPMISPLGQMEEAEPGGGVVAGTETESGIEPDHHLAGFRTASIPSGFDEKIGTDIDGGEVTFPGLGPIFGADPADGDSGWGRVETRGGDLFEQEAQ